MKAIGLPLFAAEGYGSPAITAVAPEGIDAEQLRKEVKDRFDILLAGGQDHLKGQVFRIGHLGFVCDRDVLTAVAAIESVLQSLGLHKGSMGAGRCAAAAALTKQCANHDEGHELTSCPGCGCNSVVECQLPKLNVAGSNPVTRLTNQIGSKLNCPKTVQRGLKLHHLRAKLPRTLLIKALKNQRTRRRNRPCFGSLISLRNKSC